MARREKSKTNRVAEMAEFSGVSEQALRKWFTLPGFPRQEDGSVCLWDLAVWRTRLDVGDQQTDPELVGGDSPGLERYRLARAQQEEIKLEAMRKDYLRRDDIRMMHGELATLIRKAGDEVQRRFGVVAGEILNDAINEFEKRIEQRWGNANQPDAEDEDSEPA